MASLPAELPQYCHQTITPSYHRCGCLRLPERFCNAHMSGDERVRVVAMVDKSGVEYEVNYLKKRRELGSGWRQLSKDNNFCVGDLLLFQLIEKSRFKVFAVGADHGSGGGDSSTVAEHNPKESVRRTDLMSVSGFEELVDLDSEEEGRDKGIEDFTIVVNGMYIDSEVSEQDRAKYYKLCRSQNSYLHQRLLEDVNTSQWAATIISRTVNIADSIKNCQFSTPRSEYESWDKILNSFELLGMDVEFLQRLVSLAFGSEGAEVFRRLVETRQALLRADESIESLESDIEALEGKKRRLEVVREKREELVHEMKERVEVVKKCEERFKEEVGAEW